MPNFAQHKFAIRQYRSAAYSIKLSSWWWNL